MTMKCDIFREQITAYLADQLSIEDENAMEYHTRQCKRCDAELYALKPAYEMLQASMIDTDAPEHLEPSRFEKLMNIFNGNIVAFPTARPARRTSLSQKAAIWGSLAASIILGCYFGLQSSQERNAPDGITIQITQIEPQVTSDTFEVATLAPNVSNTEGAQTAGDDSRPEYGLGSLFIGSDTAVFSSQTSYFKLPWSDANLFSSPTFSTDGFR